MHFFQILSIYTRCTLKPSKLSALIGRCDSIRLYRDGRRFGGDFFSWLLVTFLPATKIASSLIRGEGARCVKVKIRFAGFKEFYGEHGRRRRLFFSLKLQNYSVNKSRVSRKT